MTEDYAHALKLLEESEAAILAALANVSEAQWSYKPAPELWSIAETAEHIVRGEAGIFNALQQALTAPPDPDWETKTAGKTEFVEQAVPNRRRKARAPQGLEPQSTWTLEQTLAQFRKRRAKTMEFVREAATPLDGHTYDHPFPVFNTLSAYQWLIYIPLHGTRHAQQIAEIKASPGYPAAHSLRSESDYQSAHGDEAAAQQNRRSRLLRED